MSDTNATQQEHSPFLYFSRQEWAQLRNAVPLPLSEAELESLRGSNEAISLDEVTDVYLPLSRLLNLYVHARQRRGQVLEQFLGTPPQNVPYVISIAGSVAVGKSTTARILRALLARWPNHPKVALVTTDGFLYPNSVLAGRGLMKRKGFPESYDIRRLVQFVADVKSGCSKVCAPVYSHVTYDVVPDQLQVVEQPDILILEGLNVLQSGMDYPEQPHRVFVSDFVDFSIFVDASPENLQKWYVERFLRFRESAFRDPHSYFHHYAEFTHQQALETATSIWNEINAVNLRENIIPTKDRARLILKKGDNHAVCRIRLRK